MKILNCCIKSFSKNEISCRYFKNIKIYARHINDSQNTTVFIIIYYLRATCFDSLGSSSGPPMNRPKTMKYIVLGRFSGGPDDDSQESKHVALRQQIIIKLSCFDCHLYVLHCHQKHIRMSCIKLKIYTFSECPRRNVPDFGRVFLMLKYTDITQNTYVQS